MPDGDNRATATDTHDVCPSCKGAGEHYDTHWRHGGTAAVCHTCGKTGLVERKERHRD